MDLQAQIEEKSREIRTDGYAMSIGEVIGLVNDGEIDIHPEFQRIFRWKDDQKSRLIESILLGIPVPSIFVSQRNDGVWDVIDGVQRLSTILEFTGNYVDEDGARKPGFVLDEGEYLTAMKGFSWGGGEVEGEMQFGDVLRRDFKRAKLEFRIITKGSDSNAKYDLFQRLNSGSVLSLQEARNCLLVMINRGMFQEIQKLADAAPFSSSIQLSERQEEQAYSQELVLRFFSQQDYAGESKELPEEYGQYLTNWMRMTAEGGGLRNENVEEFRATFELLVNALGEDAFRRWNGVKHLGPFSIASYEFITSGVAHNLAKWQGAQAEELRDRVRSVWTAPEFRDWSGTGFSSKRRVPILINNARQYFA